jgi:hypothetical protein
MIGTTACHRLMLLRGATRLLVRSLAPHVHPLSNLSRRASMLWLTDGPEPSCSSCLVWLSSIQHLNFHGSKLLRLATHDSPLCLLE